MEWRIILRKRNVLTVVLLLLLLQAFLYWFHSPDVIIQQEKYAEEFHANVEAVMEQADSMGSISIFSQKDSFTERNQIKTKEDFSNLLDVEPIVFDGSFLTDYFSFSLTHILAMVAGFFLVFAFSNEDRPGLRSMIFSTRNGRGRLNIRKMMALFFLDAILVVAFYGVTFLLSILRFQTGFIEYLAYPIQSLALFVNFPWRLEIGSFLVIYFIYHWLILFLITLIAWVILCYADRILIAVGTISIIGVLNFVVYQLIGSNHPWNMLHYCNLWYLIKDASFFTEYKNMNLFSRAINKNLLIIIIYFILIFLLTIALVWAGNHRYPCASQNHRIGKGIVKASRYLQNISANVQEGLSTSRIEYYKLLISQKGIVVIVILFLVLLVQTDMTDIQRSGSQEMYYNFMDKYVGKPNEQSQQEIVELSNTIATIDKEYETKVELYNQGKLSAEEYMDIVQKDQLYVQDRIFLKQIQGQTEYLQALEAERNIQGWYVNMYSYTHLLREGDILWNTFLIMGVSLLCSSVFSREKQCGITQIIRGTVDGRKEFFGHKIRAAFMVTLGIYLLTVVFEIGAVKKVYGLKGLAAPIQSIEQLSFMTLSCSIGTFIIALYFLKGILLLAFATITCAIALRYSQKTAIAAFLICCIPTILTTMGFTFFRYISLTEILSIAPFLMQTQSLLLMLGISLIFVITSIFSIRYAYRKWCIT